jgi:energy-coupling factor transporter transmembrane protein EcfT
MVKNIKKFLYFLENYIFSAISRTPRALSYRKKSSLGALSISKLYLHLIKAGKELHFALKSRGWEKKVYPSSKIKFNFAQFLFLFIGCSLIVILLIFL